MDKSLTMTEDEKVGVVAIRELRNQDGTRISETEALAKWRTLNTRQKNLTLREYKLAFGREPQATE